MMISSITILANISYLALWGLVLALGIWLYRRFRLRSLPWLGAYATLSLALTVGMPSVYKQVLDTMAEGYSVPPGWTVGQCAVAMSYSTMLLGNLTRGLLAILMFSEIVFLISRSDIRHEGILFNRFLAIHDRTTFFGVAMVVPMLLQVAIVVVAHFYIQT